MAASATPGPWKSYKDGVHPVLENGSSGNDHFAICQCFGPDALRNQRLIAAAPELLAAAERALNFIANTEGEMGETLESGDMLRAAIAKARGEVA